MLQWKACACTCACTLWLWLGSYTLTWDWGLGLENSLGWGPGVRGVRSSGDLCWHFLLLGLKQGCIPRTSLLGAWGENKYKLRLDCLVWACLGHNKSQFTLHPIPIFTFFLFPRFSCRKNIISGMWFKVQLHLLLLLKVFSFQNGSNCQ